MIINILSKKVQGLASDESSLETCESDNEDTSDKNERTIGKGRFGKKLEVREEMDKEAEMLRNQWKGKRQKGSKPKGKKKKKGSGK